MPSEAGTEVILPVEPCVGIERAYSRALGARLMPGQIASLSLAVTALQQHILLFRDRPSKLRGVLTFLGSGANRRSQ